MASYDQRFQSLEERSSEVRRRLGLLRDEMGFEGDEPYRASRDTLQQRMSAGNGAPRRAVPSDGLIVPIPVQTSQRRSPYPPPRNHSTSPTLPPAANTNTTTSMPTSLSSSSRPSQANGFLQSNAALSDRPNSVSRAPSSPRPSHSTLPLQTSLQPNSIPFRRPHRFSDALLGGAEFDNRPSGGGMYRRLERAGRESSGEGPPSVRVARIYSDWARVVHLNRREGNGEVPETEPRAGEGAQVGLGINATTTPSEIQSEALLSSANRTLSSVISFAER